MWISLVTLLKFQHGNTHTHCLFGGQIESPCNRRSETIRQNTKRSSNILNLKKELGKVQWLWDEFYRMDLLTVRSLNLIFTPSLKRPRETLVWILKESNGLFQSDTKLVRWELDLSGYLKNADSVEVYWGLGVTSPQNYRPPHTGSDKKLFLSQKDTLELCGSLPPPLKSHFTLLRLPPAAIAGAGNGPRRQLQSLQRRARVLQRCPERRPPVRRRSSPVRTQSDPSHYDLRSSLRVAYRRGQWAHWGGFFKSLLLLPSSSSLAKSISCYLFNWSLLTWFDVLVCRFFPCFWIDPCNRTRWIGINRWAKSANKIRSFWFCLCFQFISWKFDFFVWFFVLRLHWCWQQCTESPIAWSSYLKLVLM